MSIPHDFPAIQRFERLGDTDWETLKSAYTMTIRLEGECKLEAAQQMQKYIEDSDIVDYASYREAILRIFPATYFNLNAEPTGVLAKTPQGGYTFTATWYHFIVTQKTIQLPTGIPKSEKCIIAIKAPGSRKLTSDIDTSIYSEFKGEDSFFEHAAARVKNGGPDFEGRISNAVIEGFYEITEELFKRTSSSQRGSNAYTDTLANDQEAYPKFLHDEENNPSIQGERLFSEEEFTKIFKECKYTKHVQEMAASLFSLRYSLEEKEWQEFKEQAQKKLSKMLTSELSKDGLENHISLCQKDYDTIFQGVENLYHHHLAKLNAKIQELEQLDPLPVGEQDIPGAAFNRLYVEHLEKSTTCRNQILALKSKGEPLVKELKAVKQALDKELAVLNKYDHNIDDEDTQELIDKKKKKCALLEKKYKDLQNSLRENIQDIARWQTDYHLQQILANTFANQAYVCRSAVYHVVNEQSGEHQPISQQTLLGSALQQVGFKLLHTKELAKNYSSEEVAYYTAKYGQRIFNLVFSGHHAEFTDEIVKALAKGKKRRDLPKFTYLKSKQVRQNAYSTLKGKELTLLNHQAKIVHRIKSDSKTFDSEKPKKTLELIQQLYPFSNEEEKKRYFENEKKLYLSLSAKLIGLVCASRLDKKGYLWGQNPSIPLRHKFEEKKERESSIPLSTPTPMSQVAPKVPESVEEQVPLDRKGMAIDKNRQLSGNATSVVMGKGGTYISGATQEDSSLSIVAAGYPGEVVLKTTEIATQKIAGQLATGIYEKQPQVSNSLEPWPSDEPSCCEHSLTESFMVLYPHLSTKFEPTKPLAIVKDNQLVGANSQMHIHSSSVIHYHGTPTSRLSGIELQKRLKDLQQLKCPGCIKDLIAQGCKFLKETKEEISLHGVFYLATAYELYRTLNIQEYKFDRQALDEYLDSLEERLVNEENLLHYFAAQENLSIFIYLFAERQNTQSGLNVLAGKTAKETPLHMAIRTGSIPIVQFLFDQGADFKKLDSDQNNALHHACRSQKDCFNIVELLLQHDPTLRKAKNSAGQTPLHLAAFAGNAKSLEYLLDQIEEQLELDHQDKKGNTPLHLAILGWNESSTKAKDHYGKVVEALVKKGTSLNALNYEKKTALELAYKKGNEAIIDVLVQANLSPQFLASSLQSFYLSHETLSIFRIKAEQDWEFKVPLEEIYVRLGIIENAERKIRDQALGKHTHSDSLQDGRILTSETIFESKQDIELEKLFEHESLAEKETKRIYIQGAAGIGKSTLCHYIAYRWAKEELWQGTFSHLLWIPLRNLSLRKYPDSKEYTPADLITREYKGKIDRRVIEACIHDPAFREKTLLILDGYDELSSQAQGNTSLAKAFKELKELFPHILITSRPGSCSFERSCELELLGFDKEGISRYIDRFFKQAQAEEKKEKLYHLLNSSPQILSLAHIPINLSLLCCLFNEDSQVFDTDQSITMTAIYERMVNWMYKWFLLRRIGQSQSNQTQEHILAEKNLRQNPEVANIAAVFEEMADFAMKNNTLYLSKQEIDHFRGKAITSNELIDCGLMRIPDERGYFIHLTFQEFLTASKVANQYLTGENRQACQNFVRDYKPNPRYSLVLRMIAGYISLLTSGNRLYLVSNPLQSFFDDLFAEPQDLAIRSELNLIAECFEECQNPALVRQYKSFIEVVKDYIPHLSGLGLGSERLLRNKNLLNHPQIIGTIRGLLLGLKTKKNILRTLISLVGSGQRLAPGIVKSIIRILHSPDGDSVAQQYALSAVEKMAKQENQLSNEAIEILIQILQRGDSKAKSSATNALRAVAQGKDKLPKEVLNTLLQVFKEKNHAAGVFIVNGIGAVAQNRGELAKEALDALIQILQRGNSLERMGAVHTLKTLVQQEGEIAKEALDALIQALKEGDEGTKGYAANALQAITKQGGELSRKALDALIQILKKGDPLAKMNAMEALLQRGEKLSKEVGDAFNQILKEGNVEAKRFAVDTLKRIIGQGIKLPKEVVNIFIQILKENDFEAKKFAVAALRAVMPQEKKLPREVLNIFISLLKEGDPYTKGFAAYALGVLIPKESEPTKELVEVLIQLLKEKDSVTKRYAADLLGTVAENQGKLPKEAADALIPILKEGHPATKSCAIESLSIMAKLGNKLPKEALDALIQILEKGEHGDKMHAADALGAVGAQGDELAKEAVDALIQILEKGQNGDKRHAADALGAVGTQGDEVAKEAIDALTKLLEEEEYVTKRHIIHGLKVMVRLGGKLSKKEIGALIQILQENDPAAQERAADTLRVIVEQKDKLPKEAVDALIQFLKKATSTPKKPAAHALGNRPESGGKLPPMEVLPQYINRGGLDALHSVAAKNFAINALGAAAQNGCKLPKEAVDTLIHFLKEGDSNTKKCATNALKAVVQSKGEFTKEVIDAFSQILREGDLNAKKLAAHALGEVIQSGGKLPIESLVALIRIFKESDFDTQTHTANALATMIKLEKKFSKEGIDSLIQILQDGNSVARGNAAFVLRTIAIQECEIPNEALATLIRIFKEGDSDAKSLAISILEAIHKKTLLKMAIEAFPLITRVCFFTEDSFSIKEQKVQISDKREVYFLEDKHMLSYEEIRKKLPKELAVWRKRLDHLSSRESSQ
ncbi:ankyrin repeat domain-containing protein [Parachlamydia sp. AcF125]|uniref:ankyrin repeat domain-containing protein n=1 Tax=Parachlamydia sp. AcF125 TaxID=2795736 RepID=UPI001BC92A3B|nr:ankyrin repeat domain-containing protein [Parachlamydia sp. AcF125]MBS4168304.1 hypothetical protein [Parachlamydia sp. AcF125]